MSLTRQNVRAFLDRDWAAARRAKDEALGAWVRARGATAAFRLAQSLLDQVWHQLARDPSRRADFSGLIRMRERFARAQAAQRR